jgi:putative acetyltransferase
MPAFEIVEDDLSGEGTIELLKIHLAGMHASSPPGHVFALDLSGLKRPDVPGMDRRADFQLS